jgi:hypothetical protein
VQHGACGVVRELHVPAAVDDEDPVHQTMRMRLTRKTNAEWRFLTAN